MPQRFLTTVWLSPSVKLHPGSPVEVLQVPELSGGGTRRTFGGLFGSSSLGGRVGYFRPSWHIIWSWSWVVVMLLVGNAGSEEQSCAFTVAIDAEKATSSAKTP